MNFHGAFVGINKYVDKNISDLAGAWADATKLWALFSDSVPEIKAQHIVDEEATVETVRNSYTQALNNATEEDVVIVSFAGHGTNDHRLVLHDTDSQNLANSTIPMEEIAELFKKTKAKIIVCILDCCFSGGATARVFEESPAARSFANPLDSIAGEGRIIVAASNYDQPAYEHSASGHGLLTKILIDELQKECNFVKVTNSLLERVRIEASKMGVQQTPVILSHVTGGINLPILQPGSLYYSIFPETTNLCISNNISELKKFGLPQAVIEKWDKQFENGLNELQLDAINNKRILDGKSLVAVAPTSSGKTFLGELAFIRVVTQRKKAVLLLPYKALVNEKYEQFISLYQEALGIRIIRCSGDYSDNNQAFIKGKYDLALLTYEMFLNISIRNQHTIGKIGLIILDEAQFINNKTRGINVELLLTNIIKSRKDGIDPQIIALSAVIGDINDFDSWLGIDTLITNKRPVPLIEGVIDRTGIFHSVDNSLQEKKEQLLQPEEIIIRRKKPSSQDLIVPLVKKLVSENKKVIVFRNNRGSAQGCARYLADELNLGSSIAFIDDLPNHDLSSTSQNLQYCLERGVAFHNTNLKKEEKSAVEAAFRKQNGKIMVLVATTTIAAGINTPANTVILAEHEFPGQVKQPFTVSEYKNMAGRAGRLGFNEKGTAILIASHKYERENLFNKYIMGQLEPLNSSFNISQIETWIIRLLAQISKIPRKEIVSLLANTYGGYLANRDNPNWHEQIEQKLENFLHKMIKYGFIEEELDTVQLSLLGRAWGESNLSFKSVIRFINLIRSFQKPNFEAKDLMIIMQSLPELDDTYTPIYKRGKTSETKRQSEAVEKFGTSVTSILQKYINSLPDYYARCKRACILDDWINGKSTEYIEQRYSYNPYSGNIGYGDILNFANTTRFYLSSAYQITSVLLMGSEPSEESVEILLKQLETGIPKEAIGLLNIQYPFNRGERLALYSAGVKSNDDFWNMQSEILKELIGLQKAEEIELERSSFA